MIQLLTDCVLIITGFQLILLGFVLLRQQTQHRFNRNLLAAFLFAKAFLILRWFSFRFNLLIYTDHAFIYFTTAAGFFLLAPLLYFYIKSLSFQDFRLNRPALLHFLPFLLILLLAVTILEWEASEGGTGFLEKYIAPNYWKIFWTSNLLQILGYISLMIHTVVVYRQKIQNYYSTLERINFNWLLALLAVISLHWIFVVFRSFVSVFELQVPNLVAILDLFSISIFLVFTTFLVLKSLNQLKILSVVTERPKYGPARLANVEIERFGRMIENFMQTEKPYLIPTLTIEDLARKLSMPSWQLSQVINDHFQQNFFNFINDYRIQEAKNLFADPEHKRKTVLEILFEVGFNSKSTFNSVFKKCTGMTPSEFKKISQLNPSQEISLQN